MWWMGYVFGDEKVMWKKKRKNFRTAKVETLYLARPTTLPVAEAAAARASESETEGRKASVTSA